MRALMDLSLLSNVANAFDGEDLRVWTPWDRYSVAHVTLSLILHESLQIHIGDKAATGLYALLARKLGNFVVGQADSEIYLKSVNRTGEWIDENREQLLTKLRQVKSDNSFEAWLDWHRRNAWMDHINRMHSLMDHSLWRQVGSVLGLTQHDSKSLHKVCGTPRLVSQWIIKSRPPEPVVDAYTLSALVRGRFYQELASHRKGQYAFHPMREYVLGGGADVGACKIPTSARTLAAILVSSAFQERTRNARLSCWADNLQTVRNAVKYGEVQFPDSGTAASDIEFARTTIRHLNLNSQWKLAKKIFETVDSFVFELCLGIGIGGFLENIPAGIALWMIGRSFRPTRDKIGEEMTRQVSLSNWRLNKLASAGPGRILLVKGKVT